ncbi:hypothetical protein IFM89_007604 [Coptis chinensis]|uniref:NB-ARC domain-containing protein n=1 Tax=Coptis chinensis TaxID=261450 RepID=A0A835LAG9_9MAGN|nr:hypothetical protein IFM89_007604 [Coptis chinensis]
MTKLAQLAYMGCQGYIGKTKLIQAISKQMKMDKLFDKVVMVNVPINLDLKKIQIDIANQLDLYFGKDEPFSSRSVRLLERLNQNVKTLIVLDNQWERLELAEVGILALTKSRPKVARLF